MISRRALVAVSLATPVWALVARPVLAETPKWFATEGIAINGYDPVAYFKDGAPTEGLVEFSTEYDGVTWQFANAENLATFAADPSAYVPQFGGYCAYAVSRGYTASTQPDAWTVWEGRLYLNYSKTVRILWSRDIPGNVAKAEANWPGVLA